MAANVDSNENSFLKKYILTLNCYKNATECGGNWLHIFSKHRQKLLVTNLLRGVGNLVSIERSRSRQVRPERERLRREPRVRVLVRAARRGQLHRILVNLLTDVFYFPNHF